MDSILTGVKLILGLIELINQESVEFGYFGSL